MRNGIDVSSWYALLSTVISLVVVTLVIVGIRLLMMQTVQHRRERQNRQINERLKTLIAAYKTLGGSFTGDLSVDPTHLRDVSDDAVPGDGHRSMDSADGSEPRALRSTERSRRVRDAVEAALSDVMLLGTEEQVRLAARAASDLAAGRPVETAELVVSLRSFIREVLDLAAVPDDVVIPRQGPSRPGGSGGRRGEKGAAGGGKAGGAGNRGGGGSGAGAGGVGLDGHRDMNDPASH